jgi:hypothetical protein
MIRILLQTTIPSVEDDWCIRRYSLLREYLASLKDERGEPLFAVTGRDREPDSSGHDPLLGGLADSDFDIPVEPVHDLLRRPDSPAELIEFFPAHPHEGGVGAPEGETDARVIAMGRSKLTNRPFNLVVAFEGGQGREGNRLGRALAHSSFHHFADYNWDTDAGCPSFVDEPPGDRMKRNPRALADIQAYVRNAALWLAGEGS